MSDDRITRQVTVGLENGLHMVPCSRIAKVANQYGCDVQIVKEATTVDAKSIFDLLTLNAGQGTHLLLEASGENADAAIAELVGLFESNFEPNTRPGIAKG